MAVTMSDAPIRKACDRCHRQKLSCKRLGDEACERCIRLKEECTSSPSLRYRKQLQHGSTRDLARKRVSSSPRRQRKEGGHPVAHADLSIVKAPNVASVCSNTGYGEDGAVSSDAMLDMVDFDFGFGGHSAGLYQSGQSQQQQEQQQQQQQQPVHQAFGGSMEALMSDHGDTMTQSWSPVHSATSESTFTSPMAPETGHVSRAYLGSPSSFGHMSTSSDLHDPAPQRTWKKRIRQQRARQIMLRPYAGGQGSSTEEWMPRITQVNSRLFELSSDLPTQMDSSEEHGRCSMASTPDDGSPTAAPFPIDEMFKLSRHFADIVAEVSPPAEVGSPASDDGSSQVARRLNSLSDPATYLFVLSTYVRLLDMYQKVFSCIHSELAQLELGKLFQSWKLPGVTVGSFAVDSTPSLQMSLTIQLAEEFLLQMRRATASLDPALRSDGSPGGARASDTTSMFSGVVDVSFQALKRQEESLGKELKELHKAMEAFLDG